MEDIIQKFTEFFESASIFEQAAMSIAITLLILLFAVLTAFTIVFLLRCISSLWGVFEKWQFAKRKKLCRNRHQWVVTRERTIYEAPTDLEKLYAVSVRVIQMRHHCRCCDTNSEWLTVTREPLYELRLASWHVGAIAAGIPLEKSEASASYRLQSRNRFITHS